MDLRQASYLNLGKVMDKDLNKQILIYLIENPSGQYECSRCHVRYRLCEDSQQTTKEYIIRQWNCVKSTGWCLGCYEWKRERTGS